MYPSNRSKVFTASRFLREFFLAEVQSVSVLISEVAVTSIAPTLGGLSHGFNPIKSKAKAKIVIKNFV